jgi:hypothetical protein
MKNEPGSPDLIQVIMDLAGRPGTVRLDVLNGDRYMRLEHTDLLDVRTLATGNAPQVVPDVTINVNNNASAESAVYSVVTFDQVVNAVRVKHPESVGEAEEQCRVLEGESKQAHPSWDRVLGVLKWSLGFGKDVVLPILGIISQMRGL